MEPFGSLSEGDIEKLLERLTLYAHRKMMRLMWRGVRYRPGMKGITAVKGWEPQDVAADAICRLLDGRREYDADKHPDLWDYLESVVDSIVSELVECAENRRTRVQAAPSEGGTGRAVGATAAVAKDAPADVVLIDQERVQRFRADVDAAVDGDELVETYCRYAAEGFKPSEVAECLGVEVAEIYKAGRRLRSKADKAARKYLGGAP